MPRGVKHDDEALRVLRYYWEGPPPVRYPGYEMCVKIAREISDTFFAQQVRDWFSNTRQLLAARLKRQAAQAAQVAAFMPAQVAAFMPAQVAAPLGSQQLMLMTLPVIVQNATPVAAHTPLTPSSVMTPLPPYATWYMAYQPTPGWTAAGVVQLAAPLPLTPFTPPPVRGPLSLTPPTAYPLTPVMAPLSHAPSHVMSSLSLSQLTPSTLSPDGSEQHSEPSADLLCHEVMELYDEHTQEYNVTLHAAGDVLLPDDPFGLLGETPPSTDDMFDGLLADTTHGLLDDTLEGLLGGTPPSADDMIGDLLGETRPSAGRQTPARPICVRVGNQSQGWRI